MSLLSTCIEQSSNLSIMSCRPVQEQLDQQLERNVLLNQVITKIQESLELSNILQTTVDEVRQFLEADRLLIYQFDQPEADDHIRSMALAGGDTEALVRQQRQSSVQRLHHLRVKSPRPVKVRSALHRKLLLPKSARMPSPLSRRTTICR